MLKKKSTVKQKSRIKQQLSKEIHSLRQKIIKLEKFYPRLKRKENELKECVVTLEEQVETRTAAERIINRQLHSEIEHRKQLEAELNTEKQLLENIVNGITEQIILVSRDFKILWANRTFLEKFGCKPQDLLGNHCYKVTHNQESPCKPPNDICPIEKVLKTGIPITEVHVHEGAHGKFFSEVTAYPIKNQKGEVIEFVHIAKDVTGPKEAGK